MLNLSIQEKYVLERELIDWFFQRFALCDYHAES